MTHSTVLITGASAGIGEACARLFAARGARLILWARRSDRLSALGKELHAEFGCEIFTTVVDIRNRPTVEQAIADLPDSWKSIDVLVNNAGLSRGLSPFHEGSHDDWEEMIDTNVKGLIYVSRAVLPLMVRRASGTVVNIASIAGRQTYPGGNVYGATKAAVKQLSDSWQIDLNGTGVRVANVDPGLVETEFSEVRFHGDSERAKTVYENYSPLTAMDVAEVVGFIVSRPPHVSIQDVLITPTDQATAMIVNKKATT